MPSLSETWGTAPDERQLAFPCDEFIPQRDAALYRGVTIHATPEVIFSWLCQMRVAPYSYDLIDNGGRQSPSRLTPGLDELALGQTVMQIFDLIAFTRNQHLTIRIKPRTRASRIFGDIAVSYLIVRKSATNCRLLVKLIVRYPSGFAARLMRRFLPWGDLIMMRRQLLNFKNLAEQTSRDLDRN
ncbi:MAG: hypothetical protein ACR2G5_02790 [Pyrinomonadaceae bacterium]